MAGLFKRALQAVGLKGTDAPQFNPTVITEAQLAPLKASVKRVDDLANKDITGVRDSTQIQLDQLGQDRLKSADSLRSQGQGLFSSLSAQSELTGQGGGSSERLGRNISQDVVKSQQENTGNFDRLASGLTSDDFGQQEANKDRALFSAPELHALPLQIQAGINDTINRAAAGNAQARQLAESASLARLGNTIFQGADMFSGKGRSSVPSQSNGASNTGTGDGGGRKVASTMFTGGAG